jgi:hypothetical protein
MPPARAGFATGASSRLHQRSTGHCLSIGFDGVALPKGRRQACLRRADLQPEKCFQAKFSLPLCIHGCLSSVAISMKLVGTMSVIRSRNRIAGSTKWNLVRQNSA